MEVMKNDTDMFGDRNIELESKLYKTLSSYDFDRSTYDKRSEVRESCHNLSL
jgi:hypothetical protein